MYLHASWFCLKGCGFKIIQSNEAVSCGKPPPGTQTDTSLFSESWTLDKDTRLGLTRLWSGRVWELPKARLAPWRCLTQSGRAPQVGTRWQRSRKTLMTITQGCRPLALAFGGRSTWEAPGSSEHMAGVGRGAIVGAKRARLSQGSEPGRRSHAGSGGIEGLQCDQASLLGCGRQPEADSTPKWPSLRPSANQQGQSGGHPFQAPNPIGQEVTSIMMGSAGQGHIATPPMSAPGLSWEPARH